MITIINEDIFTTEADIRVNPVNCVGVMGGGLAREFRLRYPKMYQEYLTECNAGQLKVGKLHIWRESSDWIINFPTKSDYKFPSQYSYIVSGLQALADYLQKESSATNHNITVAIPALGCGLGGLKWDRVSSLIHQILDNTPLVTVKVIEPKE